MRIFAVISNNTKLATFCLVAIFLVSTSIFYFSFNRLPSTDFQSPLPIQRKNTGYINNTKTKRYLVDTPGCTIPDLDPFDDTIIKYIKPMSSVKCSHRPPLTTVTHGLLAINKKALKHYGVSEKNISCCYQAIVRITQSLDNYNSGKADNSYRIEKNCTVFTKDTRVAEDYIRVTCHSNKMQIYKDVFSLVVLRPEIENRTLIRNHKGAGNHRVIIDDHLNVLLLGMDSVSRLSLHRHMQVTFHYLTQVMGAVELNGFNKVGDNTFPNVVPLLSGLSVEELRKECWNKSSTPFDNCPWIWKDFASGGYVTAYGEDAPWMGIFNYGAKTGFVNQPTDYYLRPGMKASEMEIGSKKNFRSDICQGSRLSISTVLSFSSEITWTFQQRPYFQLMWMTSLTHDYYNSAGRAEFPVYSYLKENFESGFLNKTVVFFFSDHGLRWGDQRKTYIGKMEERLPFLFMYLPEWFRQKYPHLFSNLNINSHRLVTMFDMHETLKDLMTPEDFPMKETINLPENRQLSLLREIPVGRTCAMAGISSHWCTCQRTAQMSPDDPAVKKVARFVVKQLNSVLKEHKNCAQLQLYEVFSGEITIPNNATQGNKNYQMSDYSIILYTVPGNAIFEATVHYFPAQDEFSLAGSVSRLNLYGNQSWCVDHYLLKKYCYCRENK